MQNIRLNCEKQNMVNGLVQNYSMLLEAYT